MIGLVEFGAAIAFALLIRRYIMLITRVKGNSMRETLQNGDILICGRLGVRLGKIKRGDVVLCRYPHEDKKLFIKRIIGMPREELEIADGVTFIDGKGIAEGYVAHNSMRILKPRLLSSDEYFVMGDNRAYSRDSRQVGPIKGNAIVARATLRIWPINRFGRI